MLIKPAGRGEKGKEPAKDEEGRRRKRETTYLKKSQHLVFALAHAADHLPPLLCQHHFRGI